MNSSRDLGKVGAQELGTGAKFATYPGELAVAHCLSRQEQLD